MSSTPQHQTMLQCTPSLMLAFKSNLINLSANFLAEGLILPPLLAQMNNISLSEEHRACTLVDAIISKVEQNPANYDKLVQVLSNYGEFYKDVLDELQEKLDSQEEADETSSDEDSEDLQPPSPKRVKLPQSKLGINSEEDLRKYMASGKDIVSILFCGKLGTGKSSLVNGMMGEKVAEEGTSGTAITDDVNLYEGQFSVQMGEMNKQVTMKLWDSPGQGDPLISQEDEDRIITKLAELSKNVDHMLYCLDMRRRLERSDLEELQKFASRAGPDVWKHTTLALTFANEIASNIRPRKDRVEQFQKVLKTWIEPLQTVMVRRLGLPEDVVKEIPIVPVGYENKSPPDRKDWFSPLWVTVFQRMKPEAQPSMFAISSNRMKCKETDDISLQATKPEDKSIYLNAEYPSYGFFSPQNIDNNLESVGLYVGAVVGVVISGGLPEGGMLGMFIGRLCGGATASVVKSITNYFTHE